MESGIKEGILLLLQPLQLQSPLLKWEVEVSLHLLTFGTLHGQAHKEENQQSFLTFLLFYFAGWVVVVILVSRWMLCLQYVTSFEQIVDGDDNEPPS